MLPIIFEQVAPQVAEYVVSNPEQSLGLFVGLSGGVFHYQKTGKLPLGRLPYKHIRELLREFGDRHFKTSRPRGVRLIKTDIEPSTLNTKLRDRHYESGDLVSYQYDGEVYNLRRAGGYDTDTKSGKRVEMENHIRIFETEDGGSMLLSHYEPHRFSETSRHLKEHGMSWSDGIKRTKEDLNALQIEYTEYESESTSDVTVVS